MRSEETDKAMRLIRKDYDSDVKMWGDDFIKRIKDDEFDDRDTFIEAMDQELDGAERVIVTLQARLGLLASENEDAAIDDLGIEGLDFTHGIPYSAMMLQAFRADVAEYMDRKGVDIDDEDIFEEE